MGRTRITRRHALAAGGLAGLGSLLGRSPLAAAADRRPPTARAYGLEVRPQDFEGTLSRPIAAPGRFELLGLRGVGGERVHVRARRRGAGWSAWIPLAVHGDHAPDAGGALASDPVWFGASDEIQLRTTRRPRAALRLHLVSVSGRSAHRPPGRNARAAAVVAPGTPPPIIPRGAWGPGFLPRTTPSFGVVQAAFIHHTVNANNYAAEQSASIVLAMAKYHRDANGWNDLGYNFVVDSYGQVFEGRAGGVDMPVVGAHAQGYNSQSTGIAVIGTYEGVPITDAAMQAIAQLLGWKMSWHGVPCEGVVTVTSAGGDVNRYRKGVAVDLQRICGHRDGDMTECPGNALYAQLPALRAQATAQAGPLRRPGQVTITPAEQEIPFGADAVFTGLVTRPDATAAANESVHLQKVGPSGRWATIARAVTAADGSWSVRLPWRRSADVRARAAGMVSQPLTVAIVARLSVLAAPKRVRTDRVLRMSGRIRPHGQVRVTISRQDAAGRFRYVTTVRARVRNGVWRASIRLRRAGVYRITPRAGGGAIGAAGPRYVRAVRRGAVSGGSAI